MSTIFSKIIKDELPSYKVYENNHYLAFLDINPVQLGHVLVIPKQETDYLFDLDTDHYLGLWKFSKNVARAMKKALPCQRIGVSVIGLEVPHVHIHLVPINDINDIDFNKKKSFSKHEMIDVANKIRDSF